MAQAKQTLQSLQQGKKDIQPIKLAWFDTGNNQEPPQLLPDFDMPATSGRGFRRLTQEQATQRLKESVPLKPGTPREHLGTSEFKETIQEGQTLFDWYLQQADTSEFKQKLTTGEAVSKGSVLLNGAFFDKEAAAKAVNLTPEQLSSELSLLGKRQAETKAEQQRIAALPPKQQIPLGEQFKPTDFSVTSKLSDLQTKVFDAPGGVAANKEFVNGVFKAFHNRDATEQELAAHTGKNVEDVRKDIIGGAQAAGLPTVSPGLVDIPTGILTPEEAEEQGYQKVLRPDQLSAFSEDQIIRDNRGGIYLDPDTTSEAQKESVASGVSGNQIAKVTAPTVTNGAGAEEIDASINAPDPESFADIFLGSGDEGSSTDQQTTIINTADNYLAEILSSYETLLTDVDSRLTTAEGGMDTLTGKIETFAEGTPTMDALNIEKQTIIEKQADFVEIQKQIANERARLDLGLAQEQDKLAPLSIIGRRQATLESRGLARIGALTSIAQILQGDLEFAKDMANATISAMNKDRELQLDAIDTLITLKDKEIVKLSNEENAILESRQVVITKAMENAQDDADKVFDLIKDNPQAAIKGKVTYEDSPTLALAKMAPYMALDEEKAKLQFVAPTARFGGGVFNPATGEVEPLPVGMRLSVEGDGTKISSTTKAEKFFTNSELQESYDRYIKENPEGMQFTDFVNQTVDFVRPFAAPAELTDEEIVHDLSLDIISNLNDDADIFAIKNSIDSLVDLEGYSDEVKQTLYDFLAAEKKRADQNSGKRFFGDYIGDDDAIKEALNQ